MSADNQPSPERKGIYFLPSLFTTAGLCFGFYGIIQAIQGDFERAAIGILIAMIMDGLDGRVARWTNTASDFGKEYDSLVDVVAFGLAPGVIIYLWSLQYLGKLGWLVSFLYVAATALRLARFNTLTIKDDHYFYGIPCPSAAAFVVFWIWFLTDLAEPVTGATMSVPSAIVTLIAAVLMVSNVKFRSFKDFDPKDKVPFVVLLVLLLVFALVFYDPATVLFFMAAGFILSGPIGWVLRWRKGNQESPAFLPDEDDEQDADKE